MPSRTGRIQETQPMGWQVCYTLLEIFTTYKCCEVYILPQRIIPCSLGKDGEKTVFGLTWHSSADAGKAWHNPKAACREERTVLQRSLHQRATQAWQADGWIYSWVIPTLEARSSQFFFSPFQIFKRIMWKLTSAELAARSTARKTMMWHNEVTNQTTICLRCRKVT